tara:strand:+ start:5391 stop:5927 length:537 start_codon:yes stop_codon:yes gene_type:complete
MNTYKLKLKKCDSILQSYSKKERKTKQWPSKGISTLTRKLLLIHLPHNLLNRIEVYFMSLKKTRFCGVCGEEGHIRSTCPNYFISHYRVIEAEEQWIRCKPLRCDLYELYKHREGNYYVYDPEKLKEMYPCISEKESKKVNKLWVSKCNMGTNEYFVGCVNCSKHYNEKNFMNCFRYI